MLGLLWLRCLPGALGRRVWLDLILDQLTRWLVRVLPSIPRDHTLVRVEGLWVRALVAIIMHHYGLVHDQASVGVKPSHVLEVVHLTLEQGQVISEHLPVKLLSNELVALVLLVLGLPRIVHIGVELDKLIPLSHVLGHMLVVLLTHVQEVLSR
jgi:hypothetical protein